MIKVEECANYIKEHAKEILNEWKCTQCGACCLYYGSPFPLESNDSERAKGVIVDSNIGTYFLSDLIDIDVFIHPKTDDEFTRCPFLRKARGKRNYRCLINDPEIKPQVCKNYPPDIDLICKGIRQVIKRKLRLKFKTWAQEKRFFKKLDDKDRQYWRNKK